MLQYHFSEIAVIIVQRSRRDNQRLPQHAVNIHFSLLNKIIIKKLISTTQKKSLSYSEAKYM
jgi:hypothetical protein